MRRLHFVRVVQRVQRLRGNIQRPVQRQRPFLPQQVLQIAAAHILHINHDFAVNAVNRVEPAQYGGGADDP